MVVPSLDRGCGNEYRFDSIIRPAGAGAHVDARRACSTLLRREPRGVAGGGVEPAGEFALARDRVRIDGDEAAQRPSARRHRMDMSLGEEAIAIADVDADEQVVAHDAAG